MRRRKGRGRCACRARRGPAPATKTAAGVRNTPLGRVQGRLLHRAAGGCTGGAAPPRRAQQDSKGVGGFRIQNRNDNDLLAFGFGTMDHLPHVYTWFQSFGIKFLVIN